MFKKITPLLVACLLCFSTQMHAQSQSEMNMQALKSYEEADAELNKVYKELVALLDSKEKALLVKAQREWIKFRDAHCVFVANDFEGGSMQPLIYSTCLEEQTRKRIAELRVTLEDRQSR